MATVAKTPSEIAAELVAFAKRHGLMLPKGECLKSHAERHVALGHCPCVESRPTCPCLEALGDVERIGRCECGILVDPARLCMLKSRGNGQ
jgi:ferredoxin-thioredoxin reductase catalytic subunit